MHVTGILRPLSKGPASVRTTTTVLMPGRSEAKKAMPSESCQPPPRTPDEHCGEKRAEADGKSKSRVSVECECGACQASVSVRRRRERAHSCVGMREEWC